MDVRFNKNTYELEFAEFVKKGKKSVFEDEDGLIAGEHAFRFLPEDDTCEGRKIDRSIVRVIETFTTTEGILRTFKARGIKPKTGNIVKPYNRKLSSFQISISQRGSITEYAPRLFRERRGGEKRVRLPLPHQILNIYRL